MPGVIAAQAVADRVPDSVTLPRIEALDSLRGVAALIVVFAHCCMMLPAFSDYGLHYTLPPAGWSDPLAFLLIRTPLRVLWMGRGPVALFFVLSGFVLVLPWLGGRPPGYPAFALRRLCRIYLPYIAAVAVAMLCASVLAPYRPAPQSEWFDTLNWTETLTPSALVSHLLMLGTHNTFNNVTWSLVHEMRISLVFPLLLLPLLRWRLAGAVALMAALVLGVMGLWRLPGENAVLREIAGSMQYAVLFVMGASTAQYASQITRHMSRAGRAIPFACLFAGLLVLSLQWPVLPTYFQGIGGVLVIVSVLTPGAIVRFLHRPALRELGRISYSLYLIHLPVLLSMVYILHGTLPVGAILLAVPPLSLAAAWGFNRYVEAPAAALGRSLGRRLGRGWRLQPARIAPAPAGQTSRPPPGIAS